MCSPEHEIELIIIAELLYMNMRGKRKSLAVGLGVQRTEEKTTGVSCVDLLLRAGMKRVQREQRGLGGARRGSSMQTSKRGAAAAGSSAAASMREEMRACAQQRRSRKKGRDRAWGRGRLGVLGLRVEIGRAQWLLLTGRAVKS